MHMGNVLRRTATKTWPLGSGWGSHRAIVKVNEPDNAVLATIEWRRRDLEPEKIGIRIKHQATGEEITSIYVIKSSREVGEILFKAPHEGIYEIYYLPFTIKGKGTHVPVVEYMKPEEMACCSELKEAVAAGIKKAELIAIESRTDFDRFDPMEIPAANKETEKLMAEHAGEAFLLFPESRKYPIRMLKELPQRWIENRPGQNLRCNPRPGEYYVFQIGVWAMTDLDNLHVSFEQEGNESLLSKTAFTCFNTEGTDCLGRSFKRRLDLKAGLIQPLWFGVDLPVNLSGRVAFNVKVITSCGEKTVYVELNIEGKAIEDRGDGDLWRLSRLRWLNSTIGSDDDVAKGYIPVQVQGNKVSCLGREVIFNGLGLPAGIQSFFTPDGAEIGNKAADIISEPIGIKVTSTEGALEWTQNNASLEKAGPGRAYIKADMSSHCLSASNETIMEYDGHLDTRITFTAKQDISLDNLQLFLTMDKSKAVYMMGMGKQGGIRPVEWHYEWDVDRANNLVWLGTPNAGIQIKLKHTEDVWEVYNYRKQGVPDSWCNQGKGGCNIYEAGSNVVLEAFTGARSMKAGESLTLRYSLLITPLKTIDSNSHWNQRYHHIDTWKEDIPSLEEAVQADATIVNLHQGGSLNQYINYPFIKSDEIREQAKQAHELGLKYKIYYTVRELSNHAEELWMIRSLGDEVLRRGAGFKLADHFAEDKNQAMTGGPWLLEHLEEGYVPAWQQILKDGDYDSAVSINGLSRWHNHYLEGLAWLMNKDGLDGIYLDGVGYDREIMKRVRKAMDSVKEGCLIDFHSGNDFDPRYGLNSPMNAYLELMPSVDSLWLGEGYDYEKQPPDYWLTEVSGIPFGLMGDMLSKGGNPWRGMVFGMTCRYGWQQGGNPLPIWRFWKSFGMSGVRMHGWWTEGCPVTTDNNDVKATVFNKAGKTLVAIASWAEDAVSVRLNINSEILGIEEKDITIEAPYIENFQDGKVFGVDEPIPVEPRRGWLLVLNKNRGIK